MMFVLTMVVRFAWMMFEAAVTFALWAVRLVLRGVFGLLRAIALSVVDMWDGGRNRHAGA